MWIAFLRGLLALLVISSLAIFGLFEIVLEPVSEMGLTPNRVFRSEYLPLTFNSTTPIVWNLIVVRMRLDCVGIEIPLPILNDA